MGRYSKLLETPNKDFQTDREKYLEILPWITENEFLII